MLEQHSRNVLMMLFVLDKRSHNVEKTYLKQHSQNILMMLFVLERSEKSFVTFKKKFYNHNKKTGHFNVRRILKTKLSNNIMATFTLSVFGIDNRIYLQVWVSKCPVHTAAYSSVSKYCLYEP